MLCLVVLRGFVNAAATSFFISATACIISLGVSAEDAQILIDGRSTGSMHSVKDDFDVVTPTPLCTQL